MDFDCQNWFKIEVNMGSETGTPKNRNLLDFCSKMMPFGAPNFNKKQHKNGTNFEHIFEPPRKRVKMALDVSESPRRAVDGRSTGGRRAVDGRSAGGRRVHFFFPGPTGRGYRRGEYSHGKIVEDLTRFGHKAQRIFAYIQIYIDSGMCGHINPYNPTND